MRLDALLAIARAEWRLTRRLVRYWVWLVFAWLAGCFGYVQYAVFIHRQFSAYSASAAALNPRYLVALYGTWYLLIFMIGLVFMGFDIRSRDERERMVEVLDAKPYSNLELVFGRFLGLMVVSWIPVALVTAFLAILGLVIKEPIEPYSLIDFLFFMTIPAFAFTIGLVFLTSILVRFRLLTVVLVGGFLVAIVLGGQRLPVDLGALANVTGGFAIGYSSDFVHFGGSTGWWGFGQRLAVLGTGIFLAVLAAALHPRLDDGSRLRRLAAAGALAAVSAFLFAGNIWVTKTYAAEVDHWREVHAAREDEPGPDVLAIGGTARIEPGRNLALDLDVRFAAPEGAALETALFSWNPGLAVESVTDDGGGELPFTFRDGLLEIELPATLDPGSETVVQLSARGFPSENFAYLDAAKHPLKVDSRDAGLFLLGFQPMLFERGYVALMPGARWLPASGAEMGRGDSPARPEDFFELDLTVQLPDGWLAAGPGRRLEGPPGPDGRVQFRFAPPAPVPDVALLASRFVSRHADIDGIRFEVLVHPDHAANVDFFEDASGEIRAWISEKLEDAADLGLPYPYDGLTLVEIPYPLRGYGGGWRMDTTLAPPGLVLMRECSLPTARFDVHLEDPEPFRDRDGGLPRAKREWLERFFRTDFTGGNVFEGVARNAFIYQTTAAGQDSLALRYLCDNLATRLMTGSQGYFSAHVFNRDLNSVIGAVINKLAFTRQSGETVDVSQVMIEVMTSRMEVWDQVLDVALSRLDPWDDPRRTLDVLTLKGGAMSRSMLDGLGREQVAEVLATLREEHGGGAFDRQELVSAGREVGEDLEPMLELWLDQTELPGFILEDVRAFRITDDEDGSPRYQILLRVRNDEPVPGMLRASFVAGRGGEGGQERERGESDPIRLAGRSEIEIGFVTGRPPASVTVEPYLSLNREEFDSELPPVDEENIVKVDPLRGHREVEWTADRGEAIVVDDLDEGFSVVDSGERPWWRFGARGRDEDTDQGLPVAEPGSFFRPPWRWSRRTASSAWGKYRHTMALVKSGTGQRKAVFTAEVPEAGSWELQLHLPRHRRSTVRGTWTIGVADGSGTEDVSFDLGTGSEGWNSLGVFEIAGGEVRVELSDDTEAPYVLADAIRWLPVGASSSEVASR